MNQTLRRLQGAMTTRYSRTVNLDVYCCELIADALAEQAADLEWDDSQQERAATCRDLAEFFRLTMEPDH